jgi:hypothetical protein
MFGISQNTYVRNKKDVSSEETGHVCDWESQPSKDVTLPLNQATGLTPFPLKFQKDFGVFFFFSTGI